MTVDVAGEDRPPSPSQRVTCVVWRRGEVSATIRAVPEETAIAFTFNGTTHAVMMATPADFEDFAVGFALTEGLIESPSEIVSLDVMTAPLGIELRIWLPDDNALDRLIGALARGGKAAARGIVLLTSRVLIELIQKAARFGAPVVAAVSVPTAAGVRLAEACGITLVAIARGQDFEMFTHHQRIIDRAQHHVA
jgi:formate dehydrogenase assembly factor FdhD